MNPCSFLGLCNDCVNGFLGYRTFGRRANRRRKLKKSSFLQKVRDIRLLIWIIIACFEHLTRLSHSFCQPYFYLIQNMSDFHFIAYKLNERSCYEEALFVANQLKWSLKLNLDQSLFSLFKFVVNESQIFYRHLYRYLFVQQE